MEDQLCFVAGHAGSSAGKVQSPPGSDSPFSRVTGSKSLILSQAAHCGRTYTVNSSLFIIQNETGIFITI